MFALHKFVEYPKGHTQNPEGKGSKSCSKCGRVPDHEIHVVLVVPQDAQCICNPMGWNFEEDCPVHGERVRITNAAR